jgi:hypothetical protein
MAISYETFFSRDVVARYTMNTWQEAMDSTNQHPPTGPRPDARKFDLVVIGGGTFGAALGPYLFERDRKHSHRVLVLEEGPLVLPEHVQNMPLVELGNPAYGGDVWKTPWRRNVGTTGLAACVGGRSVFFGGWAPQLLEEETVGHWPATVMNDLRSANGYFRQASVQIGVNEANDFVFGALHEKLREQLFVAVEAGDVTEAIPLEDLPLHLDVPPDTPPATVKRLKLEAPLAVQAHGPRAGFFPVNKFSSTPLLLRATRLAEAEVPDVDDVKKRLMVVPYVHVTELITREVDGQREVFQVKVRLLNEGNREETYELPAGGRVILANSTIESTRLALESFFVLPTHPLMGQNHIAHLRSNITIRVRRESIAGLCPCTDLESSALFVKCRHEFDDGSFGYYHFQISAAGTSELTTDSEAQLFKKIPDIDTLDRFAEADESHVVITIRGIGEMTPKRNDAQNSVTLLDAVTDSFGKRVALASIEENQRDGELWDAMDDAANQLAEVFAGGLPYQLLTPFGYVNVAPGDDLKAILPYEKGPPFGRRRDQLDSTHHEAGTLWMGEDDSESVTDTNCRIKGTANAYVCGPALFPSVGSPNPMLTGIALARRLGDHLIGHQTTFSGETGFMTLFDGIDTSRWRMSTIRAGEHGSPGGFVVVDGILESVPGNDIGLYWCTIQTPANFILKLDWRQLRPDDNSGVFLRFPNPETFIPQHQTERYKRTAYIGVHLGFEVQIDQQDADPQRRTGAIYDFQAPIDPNNIPVKPIGEWNSYEIHVQGQVYKVILNGQMINQFHFTAGSDAEFPERGLPSTAQVPRYIGLQTHGGRSRVGFRGIRIKVLV